MLKPLSAKKLAILNERWINVIVLGDKDIAVSAVSQGLLVGSMERNPGMPATKSRRVTAILNQRIHPSGDTEGLFLRLGGINVLHLILDWEEPNLPRSVFLTPLTVAALMDSVDENGVVNTVRLGEALEKMGQDPSLLVYDQTNVSTMTTSTTS